MIFLGTEGSRSSTAMKKRTPSDTCSGCRSFGGRSLPQCAGREAGRQTVSGDGGAAQSQTATFNTTFKHQIALHGPRGYYEVVSVAVSGDLNRRDQSARPLVQSASLAQRSRRSANSCCTLASVASMRITFSVAYISSGRQSNRSVIACTKTTMISRIILNFGRAQSFHRRGVLVSPRRFGTSPALRRRAPARPAACHHASHPT